MKHIDSDPQVERRRMGCADLITGCVFSGLGMAIAYTSWTMPRLEMRGVHPVTVPGLVPGILGVALAACGVILVGKAWPQVRREGGWRDLFAVLATAEGGRVTITIGLCLIYALVLVGLVPFWLASAVFVFAFVVIFAGRLSDEPKPLPRLMFWAAVQGVAVGWLVTLVFQYGFLVRLP